MIKLRSSRGSVKMCFGGILAGLAGIYFAVLSFQSYTEKSWPQAIATVDSVSVDEWKAHRAGMRYQADVSYHFTVGNKRFISYSKLESFATKEQAENDARSYPAGKTLKISYDPRDPDKTTARPGLTFISHGGTAVFFFLLGSVMYFWGTFERYRYVNRPKHSFSDKSSNFGP